MPPTPLPRPLPAWLPRLILLVGFAMLGGCSHMAAGGPKTPPAGPAGIAFYTPPSPLPPGQHGDLIWARHVSNDAALPSAAQNWLVLYRSIDIAGRPTAVSGTVAIPKGTAPAGGWPVISWTHGTTGIADICAPSRDDAHFPPREYVNLMNRTLDQWVAKGYAVVKTDYEGLGTPGTHPYLVGDTEARNAADIVLAARQLSPDLSRNWLVMGHSQGGGAAVYTAFLGPVYAQELKLTGAIAIAPSSNLSIQVVYAEKHPDLPTNAYGTLLFHSIAAVAPGVDLTKLLTPEGQRVNAQVESLCVGDLRNDLKMKDVMNMDADFSALNGAVATLMDTQNVRPSVPLLVLQADKDTAVPKVFTDMLVQRYQVLGVPLEYRTYVIDDLGGAASIHQATVPRSRQDAMDWAARHLPPGR